MNANQHKDALADKFAEQLAQLRGQFAALSHADDKGNLPIYFDGPGGSQVPKCVIDAVSGYLACGNSNMGGHNDAGVRTMAINASARQQAGVWLGAADSHQIIFGQNSTSLMFMLARTLANTWQAGDNIVLSSLDHYSHVSSWQTAAQDKGVQVRMMPMNDAGDDLDYDACAQLIDERTRLVAVSLASNVIGAMVDVAPIIKAAKAVGAKVSLDAVHACVHTDVNAAALGADFVFASAYKIGGPHLGVLCADGQILASLTPYKVEPATNITPMAYEQGTQSFEAQAGFVAMMSYWANLANVCQQTHTPANALTADNKSAAYQAVMAYEARQSEYILAKFRARPFLQLYGKQSAQGRTPTFAFNVVKQGVVQDGTALSQFLGEYNVALGYGNFYAKALAEKLSPTAQVLRMGCLHYTTFAEIDALFELVDAGVRQIYGLD
ncbi:hypothetical protein B0181_00860 [Moraxella caviae]|uniref:Cysteine desulfurase n=1 Tax=Moraxella caviae TaxID=34060 RepID=A0A1T0ABH9_9GAMM|nr:aminotransferase class V-fold PLP-dependent enzyme [Moraxella caviae]OOR93063.1 hypothetical protein B0181_00860 [Moraxella caviae]STZ10038.1 Cysteine desulfurase [Moraxella caviae]VEW12771.1 Cysteine desulfurase [Moraxella caviae]